MHQGWMITDADLDSVAAVRRDDIADFKVWLYHKPHRLRFKYCDDLTPVEAEQAHYAHHQAPATAGVSS